MACPVNHPFFHALVFLLGVIVVLSRYARAEPQMGYSPAHQHLVATSLALSSGPALSSVGQHIEQLGRQLVQM